MLTQTQIIINFITTDLDFVRQIINILEKLSYINNYNILS